MEESASLDSPEVRLFCVLVVLGGDISEVINATMLAGSI